MPLYRKDGMSPSLTMCMSEIFIVHNKADSDGQSERNMFSGDKEVMEE